VDGKIYGTYQEAARALGLFDNRDEGIMAFEELLDFGAPPSQLRWIFCVLAVEGSPALTIWDAHEKALSADIEDQLLRTTPVPSSELIRINSCWPFKACFKGSGSPSRKSAFRNQQNHNRRLMLNVCGGAEIQQIFVHSRMDLHLNR
jgi:hypothetical protein